LIIYDYFKRFPVSKNTPPSRRFRPDKEDGAVKIEGELKTFLRLASEQANKGVRAAA